MIEGQQRNSDPWAYIESRINYINCDEAQQGPLSRSAKSSLGHPRRHIFD